MASFAENTIEDASLAWLEAVAWRIDHGPDIAPNIPAAERRNYAEVALAQRLRSSLFRRHLSGELPAREAKRFAGGGA